MQKIDFRLWMRRLVAYVYVGLLVVYIFARPWTPFLVDMLVGIFGAGIAIFEWMTSRKSHNRKRMD